ncbi:alanine--glyoxylate aminotransferase 2, mitochondrial-like [Biomphalaria glabrata]|uniref:Alanine--glyoxylate aminotransferase 2, mitochondrial n=1 Tax=Biomphalaria glabrata TaxID=6526 RepID=A0A9W3AWP3_BIOGL|nr:alanine--glyoxylate aminotransferase 2, mitochondrial-like [Biomphalaria glabrata]
MLHKSSKTLLSLLQYSKGLNVRHFRCTAPASQAANDIPEMPACSFKPSKHEGPDLNSVLSTRKNNLNPALFTFYKEPVYVHQGYMQYLWDTNNKRYLDLFAGIVTVSVGHCHPAVVAAAEKQMKKLWHTTNIYLHPKIHEYAAQLVAKFPGNLKVVYFTNSGSEANDLAVLMARMYTGVYDCISLRNGYHGASPYLMGVTALSTWRYNNPTGFGFQQAMNPDPYRGPWGGKHCRDSPAQPGRQCDCPQGQCKACDMYVDQLEDVLRYSMPKGRVGAFIAEAIQGVGGAVQLPDGYLKKAYEKIRANGGVCIADEVQTGFGRMGSHYWGFESQGVMPDIVTMAKGIGNGFPMGAVVTTPEIAATMGKALHFNTFGGNPVASAVGQAVLEVIDKENIQGLCADVGTYFIKELEKLRNEFEVVGDVRGKGLMIGVELVKDKASRTPLPAEEVASIWEDTKNMGVLIGKGGLFGNCFRIKPPMCITRADVDFSIAVMRAALRKHANKK